MRKLVKIGSKKAGSAPGTLVHVGEQRSEQAKISFIDYDEAHLNEKKLVDIKDVFPLKDEPTTSWINVDGIHDIELIEEIGRHFQIHPLTLEDIVNTGQRPKLEPYETYLYMVLKMLHYHDETGEVKAEQISLILGERFLISFQEVEGDVFTLVRDRIRKGRGRIRRTGCDYLAYALIDAIVDHYFVILEKTGEQMEDLEESLLGEPRSETLQAIHELKREMIFMRKQVWPLRELVNGLAKAESELIQEGTGLFFRDVYDHTVQIIDTIESYRDLLSGMIDLYLSTISNRMNEVMKVLTIIATIFIPITFVAGIYGMNFEIIPELKWRWGYAGFWGVIILITGSMLFFFRRKKWL
ncbi:MAG: magnesium/cobalt transporter CorA [Desulfobacterales bacterium]|nr:magnesium/cobalt transporter CorA [Desulfobacterales bacterium]